MKKRFSPVFLALVPIVASLFLTACKKDNPKTEDKVTILPSVASAIFPDSLVPFETFYFKIGQTPQFTTRDGTEFTASEPFKGADGNIYPVPMKIVVRMLRSARDRILAGAPTTNRNTILSTGGQFFINSMEALSPNNPGGIQPAFSVKMKYNGPVIPFLLYTGEDLSGAGASGPNRYISPANLQWNLANIPIQASTVTIPGTDSVLLGTLTFNLPVNYEPAPRWINCDFPFQSVYPRTPIKAFCDKKFTSENSNTYVFLPEAQALVQLQRLQESDPAAPDAAVIKTTFPIPSQMEAYVILVGKIDGQYYLAQDQSTIQVPHNVVLNAEPVTLEELDNRLKYGLPRL